MAGHSKAKRQPDSRVRAQRCLDRRLRGESWAEIARGEGYATRKGPQSAVERLLDRIEFAEADRYRREENARLNALQARYWTDAIGGDMQAAEYVLKVMAQRARLLGLNVPERLVVAASETPGNTDYAATVATLMRELDMTPPPAITAGASDGDETDDDAVETDPWVNT